MHFLKRVILLSSICLLCLAHEGFSQIFSNPSFEGSRREGSPPSGWSACSQFSSPDTQPGFWRVSKSPSQGSSYVGLVTRGNLGPNANNNESTQTRLGSTLATGEALTFNIDLSYSDRFGHNVGSSFLNYDTPAKLQIYGGRILGGSSSCQTTELLWESPPIDHTEWITYEVTLIPQVEEVRVLTFRAEYTTSNTAFGNLLMDNIDVSCPLKPIDWVSDTTICDDEPLVLDVTIPGGSYQWQDGSTGSVFTVDTPGTYAVDVTDDCSSERFEVNVDVLPSDIDIDWQNNIVICENSSVELDVTIAQGTYEWQDGTTDPLYTISEAGTYVVQVSNKCASRRYETIVETRPDVLPITWDPDTALCAGDEILLDVTVPDGNYQWQDGNENPVYAITEAGNYSVVVENGCVSVRYEVDVALKPEEILLDWVSDTTICENEPLLLDVSFDGATYRWQDGSESPTYTVTTAGNYTVEVDNGCVSETFEIAVNTRNCFCDTAVPIQTVAYDSLKCEQIAITLDATTPGGEYRWQTGSEESAITIQEPGLYSVEVSNKCETIVFDYLIENITCDCTVNAPNVFTPNGDNTNDAFEIAGTQDISSYQLRIFDRSGKQIWETDQMQNYWDGTVEGRDLPAGTYYYLIELSCSLGEINNEQRGWVTILR